MSRKSDQRSAPTLPERTILGYDSNGNLTSITDAVNETMSMVVSNDGLVTSVTDRRGYTILEEIQIPENLGPLGASQIGVGTGQQHSISACPTHPWAKPVHSYPRKESGGIWVIRRLGSRAGSGC